MTRPISSEAKATWTSNGIQLAILIAALAYGYGILHSDVSHVQQDVQDIKQILRQKGFIAQNNETNTYAARN